MNWTTRLDINVDHKNGPYGHKKSIFTHFWKQIIKPFIWLPSIKIKRDGLLYKATKEGVYHPCS